MGVCRAIYKTEEKFVKEHDMLIVKTTCVIQGTGEDSDVTYSSYLSSYSIVKRWSDKLKIARVKVAGEPHGFYIEELSLPQPFSWNIGKGDLERLVERDSDVAIKEEFGINISDYL